MSASAMAGFWKMAFMEPWRAAGVWWIWLLAVVLFPVFFWRDRAARFFSLFAVFYTLSLIGVYAFSAVPDLRWHVAALDRLLTVPAAALALALGLCGRQSGLRAGGARSGFSGVREQRRGCIPVRAHRTAPMVSMYWESSIVITIGQRNQVLSDKGSGFGGGVVG